MLGLWGPCPCLHGSPRPGRSGDISPHVVPRSPLEWPACQRPALTAPVRPPGSCASGCPVRPPGSCASGCPVCPPGSCRASGCPVRPPGSCASGCPVRVSRGLCQLSGSVVWLDVESYVPGVFPWTPWSRALQVRRLVQAIPPSGSSCPRAFRTLTRALDVFRFGDLRGRGQHQGPCRLALPAGDTQIIFSRS